MSQQADIQSLSLQDILEILRNQAQSMPPSPTSSRYLRALDSLRSSAAENLRLSRPAACLSSGAPSYGEASRQAADVSSPFVLDSSLQSLQQSCSDWLVSQWLMNTPFSTASLYLDIISSLYGAAVKAGLLPPVKIFSQLKADLKALGPDGWKRGIDDEIFARALRLTKNARCLISDDAIAAALVLWSLTHSLRPLTEAALLKKPNGSGAISERAKSLSSGAIDSWFQTLNPSQRSPYLFPLRQSQRTPRQLSAHIANIVNALFKRARLPQATDPFQTVEALWAYAALRAGIPASSLVSYLGHAPLGLPILKLSVVSCKDLDSSPLVLDSSKENFSQVGKIFLENPPRWYAMSLRPGVRFTQVCRRIQLLHDSSPLAEGLRLFYPCEEIARAIGKKIVTRQRPFIHSVVFFRAKLTDIGRLFSKIGDLAWCYRQSARPGAPYADISDRQFQLFQQTIAQFTPDYEVAPSGELPLRPNDRVQILGGLFSGQEATVVSHAKSQRENCADGGELQTARALSSLKDTDKNLASSREATDIVYRLNIIGDNGIDWRITVDPRLLTPAK